MHAGDYVKVGDVLAEMADLRHVRVRAFVDEPDLGWLGPNQNVQVTWDAKPGVPGRAGPSRFPNRWYRMGCEASVRCFVRSTTNELELLPNVNVEVTILILERHGAW